MNWELLSEYLAHKDEPVVIVMDWYISAAKDGASVVEEIRRAAPDAIIAVYTAFLDARDREAATRAGVNGYIVKTGNMGELLDFLHDHILSNT